ncbi:MAG: glycosyltransferase, partial [Desulfovibrio sp.]|nr:glycosyltransferase [Desulfovibrio sp.]
MEHAGSVIDTGGLLHHIYEGLPESHPLFEKRRLFRLAHGGALLLRLCDFCTSGGFSKVPEGLAFADLSLRVRSLSERGERFFSVEPTARAIDRRIFASWKRCGLWNSLQQRGKLPPALIEPDYPLHVQADGIAYGVDDWLNEGPKLAYPQADSEQLPIVSNDCRDAASFFVRPNFWPVWYDWRHHPSPAKLLRLLSSLATSVSPEVCREALDTARSLPASLPRAFPWYAAQAERLRCAAQSGGLAELEQSAAKWQAGARRFHYAALMAGMRALHEAGIYACSLDSSPAVYDAWVELVEPGLTAFTTLSVGAALPPVDVVMPVFNPEPEHLKAAVESVRAQTFGAWRLCIADDASTREGIAEMLRAYARDDRRIVLVRRAENGHICRATNDAIALVEAPFTAFFDHDDLLAKNALAETAAFLSAHPAVRFVYTDEDKIDGDGLRRTPILKPDYDADLHYTWHLTTAETALVRELGGMRVGL